MLKITSKNKRRRGTKGWEDLLVVERLETGSYEAH
jgi:hypothetical protein